MSNIIPPLISNSPPPMHIECLGEEEDDDEDDDDFGNFTSAIDETNCSSCDALSILSTPEETPKKCQTTDINSNKNVSNKDNDILSKDYQDKRKGESYESKIEVNFVNDHVNDASCYFEEPPELIPDDFSQFDITNNFQDLTVPSLVLTNKKLVQDDIPDDLINQTDDLLNQTDDLLNQMDNFNEIFDLNEPTPNIPFCDDDFQEFSGITSEVLQVEVEECVPNECEVVKCLQDECEVKDCVEDEAEVTECLEDEAEVTECVEDEAEVTECVEDKAEVKECIKDEAEVEHSEKFGENEHFETFPIDSSVNVDESVPEESGVNLDHNRIKVGCNSPSIVDFAKNSSKGFENDGANEAKLNGAVVINTPSPSAEEVFPDDDFGDFADFTALESVPPTIIPPITAPEVSIITINRDSAVEDIFEIESDDFGDFSDFNTHNKQTEFIPNNNQSFDVLLTPDITKIKEVVTEMYPELENIPKTNDAITNDFISGNRIFDQMKDITETPAITYSWNKSSSQNALLKSLNIDMRNILHGLGWNLSVPKFAATLSSAPLEPVKSDILLPPVAQTTTTTTTAQKIVTNPTNDIPRAQFDWSSAGLTNPLDYTQTNSMMLLDLECLVASLDVPSQASPTSNDLDIVWDYWLHSDGNSGNISPTNSEKIRGSSKKVDTESVNSLQFPEIAEQQSAGKNDVEDDFVNFQQHTEFPTIPLRESHITNNNSNKIKETQQQQTSSNEHNKQNVEIRKENPEIRKEYPKIRKENPGIRNENPEIPKQSDLDDDFSDFQMSTPLKQNDAKIVTKPKEILQPTILQPKIVSTSSNQINWPDPGLSDAELANIEKSLICLKPIKDDIKISQTKLDSNPIKQTKTNKFETKANKTEYKTNKIETKTNKIETKTNKIETKTNKMETTSIKTKDTKTNSIKLEPKNKQKSLEEDDWTDFVSNKDVKTKQTERTSTPELQLCIPQLNNIQPPKQPIPVITPHGLIQTRIPTNSYNNTIMYNYHTQAALIPTKQQQLINQPSIISQQYAQQTQPSSSFNQTIYNDDDWTDFISSQPAPTTSSSLSTHAHNKTFQQQTNIISNPGHFDSFNVYNNRTINNGVNNNGVLNNVTTTLPDLEFTNGPKTKMKQ